MKSVNELRITGTVVSVSELRPDKPYTVFTLAHNFGGGMKTLYLRCFSPRQDAVSVRDQISVTAYLRCGGNGVEAYVKTIEKPNENDHVI